MNDAPEMRCPSCETALPPDAQFCGRCGERLAKERACAGCGRSNPADMRFCLGCGAPFEAGARQVTEKERPLRDRAPRAYTPKHLADRILASRSALEGCEALEARAALARALGDEEARASFLIEAERRYTEMGAPG